MGERCAIFPVLGDTFSVHLALGFTIFRSKFMLPSIKPSVLRLVSTRAHTSSTGLCGIAATKTDSGTFVYDVERVVGDTIRRRRWFRG